MKNPLHNQLYVIPEKKMYRKAVIVDTTRRQAVHRKHGSDRMDGVDGQPEHGLQYTEGDAAVEDVLRGEDSSASIVVVVSDAMSERRHDDTVAQESSGTLDSSANLLAGSSVVASTNVIGHRSPMSVRVHRNVL